MSLRSDILGWVIGQLGSIDAADPFARRGLYESLRGQVSREGAFGAAPATALPHLESAIVRQEMNWLRETGRSAELPSHDLSSSREKASKATKPKSGWRWPAGLVIPPDPPGPVPGAACGPFSDHVYETFSLDTPHGAVGLRVSWTFDPACNLAAECREIGFDFRTRAASFAYAVDHLESVLKLGGLSLPQGIRRLEA